MRAGRGMGPSWGLYGVTVGLRGSWWGSGGDHCGGLRTTVGFGGSPWGSGDPHGILGAPVMCLWGSL